MGWARRTAVESRLEFVLSVEREDFTMTELCASHGVSRKTGYKWLARYKTGGLAALFEQSRAPKSCPHKTDPAVVQLILNLRDERPTWGAKKLKARLQRLYPELGVPAPSTIHDILVREGRVSARSRRRRHAPSAPPWIQSEVPGDVWCVDFKGQFRTGDASYCYPLTVSDWATRYLIGCAALESTGGSDTREVFRRLFAEHGVPRAILSDNGVPFATPNALCRLSRLNFWWMKLGIELQRIQPGHPEQNGRHERMHRTLKNETTRPAAEDLNQQQAVFDDFRRYYNHIRPHEALDFAVPGDVYERSTRVADLGKTEYPGHFEVRRVGLSGHIKLNNSAFFISSVMAREHVGLEEIDDRRWHVYYRDYLLAHIDEETGRMNEVGPTPIRVLMD